MIRPALAFALAVMLPGVPTHAAGDEDAAELAAIAARWAAVGMAPGMGVAVVRDGRVVYTGSFGIADLATGQPVTADTRFYIASSSKSFLGLTAAVLHDQGRIDLDGPLSDYLPEVALRPPADAGAISLRDLLALRHGLEDGGPIVFRTAFSGEHSRAELLRLLAGYGPGEQGRSFNYGNLGYNIAGLALEVATGLDWQTLEEETVLRAAGMTATTARPSRVAPELLAMPHKTTPDGAVRVPMGKVDATMHAAGGHVATMADLGRWLVVNLGHGRIDGRQVFPQAAVDVTHRLHTEQDRQFGPYHRHGWGLGWDLGTYDGELLVHRFGSYSGFRSHISFMPEHGIGVAVEVNDGMLGSLLADQVANSLYDHLLRKEGAAAGLDAAVAQAGAMAEQGRLRLAQELAARRARPQIMPLPSSAYVGTFDNPDWGRMQWRLEDGALCVAIGVARSCAEVYDGAKNQLRVELTGGGEVVTFIAEGDRIVAAEYAGARFDRASP
jgi:CubicO group peptidase (beta-lactamase class C family)